RETWPAGKMPRSVAYFCGPLADPNVVPPFSDHGYPARELAKYTQSAKDFVVENVGTLWPDAVGPAGFRWDLLVDRDDKKGEVLGFFARAGARHHEDEEASLFPRLRDVAELSELMMALEEEHRAIDAVAEELDRATRAGKGLDATRVLQLTADLARIYRAHIA